MGWPPPASALTGGKAPSLGALARPVRVQWRHTIFPLLLCFPAARAVYSSSTSHITDKFAAFFVLLMLVATLIFQRVHATNMAAYSLHERPQHRFNFIMWLVCLACVEWEWKWEWARIKDVSGDFIIAFSFLFINTSESTLDCQTKAVADYMKRVSSKSSSTSSPFFEGGVADWDCCRYPFMQQKDGQWVTVKDLVQREDLPNEDQDIWLSYCLCPLLARRFYGLHCAEEGDDKVRRFALKDLGRTDGGCKRAFTIVEVQLAFLYDYFFTTSLPIAESGLQRIPEIRYPFLLSGRILFAFLVYTGILDGPITSFPIFGITLLLCSFYTIALGKWYTPGLGTWPVRHVLAIYWRPVHTVFLRFCSSPNPNAQDVSNLFQTQTDGIYWKNKIGQYSILKDYDRRSFKKALVAWFQEIVLSQPSHNFMHLPVEEEEVDMLELDSMKELVANTLRDIDGPPTNGTRSLKINMDSSGYDWSWTCRQQTHTHTILIWHIATCYCEMSPPQSYRPDGFVRLVGTDTFYEVATALSRYCAYLVAFLPEFLPVHNLDTKKVFQDVIQDAQHALGSTHMEEKEKLTKIRKLKLLPRRRQTTFHKGVRLGRQLEKLNTRLRWKVMAEFWAETILYIAPSDNAAAHIEHLAKGGEFVTHLWAMLSNAGILKRATGEWYPPASTTKKAPPPKNIPPKQELRNVPFNDEA